MNDETEGLDLHAVLTEVLALKHGSKQCTKTLDLIDTTIETHLRLQLLFSATTLEDNISQWRAYTKLGQGVCIEFEDGFIRGNKAKKVDCLYDFDEKKDAIINDQNLKANDKTIEFLIYDSEGIKEYISSITNSLVRFKNKSFQPEQEIRWVISTNSTDDPAKTLYRPHRLGLTCYQENSVNLQKIKSITIGPQVPKQNLKTIEDFAIKKGFSGLVKQSNVTLR